MTGLLLLLLFSFVTGIFLNVLANIWALSMQSPDSILIFSIPPPTTKTENAGLSLTGFFILLKWTQVIGTHQADLAYSVALIAEGASPLEMVSQSYC